MTKFFFCNSLKMQLLVWKLVLLLFLNAFYRFTEKGLVYIDQVCMMPLVSPVTSESFFFFFCYWGAALIVLTQIFFVSDLIVACFIFNLWFHLSGCHLSFQFFLLCFYIVVELWIVIPWDITLDTLLCLQMLLMKL